MKIYIFILVFIVIIDVFVDEKKIFYFKLFLMILYDLKYMNFCFLNFVLNNIFFFIKDWYKVREDWNLEMLMIYLML